MIVRMKLPKLFVENMVQNKFFIECDRHVIPAGVERTAAKWS